MINGLPSFIIFKPRNKQTGLNVNDYLLKEGAEYPVVEFISQNKSVTVRNNCGILIEVSTLDVEIVE